MFTNQCNLYYRPSIFHIILSFSAWSMIHNYVLEFVISVKVLKGKKKRQWHRKGKNPTTLEMYRFEGKVLRVSDLSEDIQRLASSVIETPRIRWSSKSYLKVNIRYKKVLVCTNERASYAKEKK